MRACLHVGAIYPQNFKEAPNRDSSSFAIPNDVFQKTDGEMELLLSKVRVQNNKSV